MKIETITHTERLNTGNYNHLELSVSAKIEEGEQPFKAMLELKAMVNAALTGKSSDMVKTEPVANVTSEPKAETNPSVAEEVKEKKTRSKKVADVIQTSPIIEEVAEKNISQSAPAEEKDKTVSDKVDKTISKYSRAIDAHKTLLSSHLTTNFPNWKTAKPKDQIVAFTTSLEGKDFLDGNGVVVDSFKKVLSDFFA